MLIITVEQKVIQLTQELIEVKKDIAYLQTLVESSLRRRTLLKELIETMDE